MPIDYSKLSDEDLIALRDGNLSKVSDRVLADLEKSMVEEQRAASYVQTPTSAFSNVRPDVTGAAFGQERGVTGMLRYGAPVAAGVATGGVGLLPAAYTALSAGGGETLAQLLEQNTGQRSSFSVPEIAAATVGAAAPVFQFKPSTIANELISPSVKSFLATLGGQLAASEGSRAILQGGFEGLQSPTTMGKAKEAVLRWGGPVLAAGVASKVPQFDKAAEDIAAIEAEGRRAILGDINSQYGPLEAKNFKAGNRIARGLAANMDQGLFDIVRQAYGDMTPQSQSEIAAMLTPYVGAFDEARANLARAKEAQRVADEALKTAEFTRATNLAEIKRAAEAASIEKVLAENNANSVITKIWGKDTPVYTNQASLGALQQRVKELSKIAESGVESGLDALYVNSGLRPNDVVISKADVLRSIGARSAQGRALEGKEARSMAERAVETFFGDSETATLEQFRNFRDIISDRLPNGSPADLASRYASSIYDALKRSSYRYIGSNYGEDTLKYFREAQNRASANFKTRSGSAIEMLKNGHFDDFYKAIKQEGPLGNMMEELNAYANSLARTLESAKRSGQVWRNSDNAAINAARSFKSDVNRVILNGIIDESIVGREAGLSKVIDVIDPQKLIKTLGYFESQGFTMRQLGITNKDISKLIKANAKVGKDPLTVSDLDEFMSLLPANGGDVAANRLAYRKAVANAMIERGAEDKTKAFQKAQRVANEANLDAGIRQQEYNLALANPVTQFFAENGTMLLGNGALQNSNWVDTIIKKDPATISKFVESLKNPALGTPRFDILDKLKEAAVAYSVKRLIPDVAGGPQKLDAEQIVAPFISQNREMTMLRENLRTLIGDKEYEKMVGLVVEPLRKVLVNRQKLGEQVYSYSQDLKGLISAQALASGKSTQGTLLAGAATNTANLIEKGYYSVLAQVWLNPQYSAQLAKVGYDLNRFMQLSERNRITTELLMQQDEREQQTGTLRRAASDMLNPR